jgi:hypothetical protein
MSDLSTPIEEKALRVTVCPHPFKLEHQEYSLAPIISLAQVLQEVQPDALLRRRAHIWVDDQYIPSEQWETTFPPAGAKIDIRVVPGRGAGRIVGSIFIAIAAIAAAIIAPLALGLTGIAYGLVGGLAGLAVGIVGTMALNALFPPVRPGSSGTLSSLAAVPGLTGSDYGQSSPTLSITGAQNKANLWGPVPFILGRYRVAPFYGARVYTESAGGDQYLRL